MRKWARQGLREKDSERDMAGVSSGKAVHTRFARTGAPTRSTAGKYTVTGYRRQVRNRERTHRPPLEITARTIKETAGS